MSLTIMPFCFEKTGYSCESFFEMLRDMRNARLYGNEEQKRLTSVAPLKVTVDLLYDLYTSGLTKMTEEDARVYQAVMWGIEMSEAK